MAKISDNRLSRLQVVEVLVRGFELGQPGQQLQHLGHSALVLDVVAALVVAFVQ